MDVILLILNYANELNNEVGLSSKNSMILSRRIISSYRISSSRDVFPAALGSSGLSAAVFAPLGILPADPAPSPRSKRHSQP